jgi:hypothetical protein
LSRQRQSGKHFLSLRLTHFDPEQNSPPDNASIAERIQRRRRHRVEVCRQKYDGVVPTAGEDAYQIAGWGRST